ncbi:hypothetical protein FB45DRAFT_671027, partial [Roridomyces roridus]
TTMSEIIDLPHTLESGMQVYPGDPTSSCSPAASIAKDGYAVCSLSLGSQTGTHVDAPAHFFANGQTISQLPLAIFMGRAVVVDLTRKSARQVILWDDLLPYAHRMVRGAILQARS